MAPLIFKKKVSSKDPVKASDLLAELSKLSKSEIKRAMTSGAVWHRRKGGKEHRIRRATFAVKPGDKLTFYYDQAILARKAPRARCEKDLGHYSIWFKPSGLLTQGTRYGDRCALTRQVETHFVPPRKVYIIHRIDRETAGWVIIGHSRESAARLSELFKKRKITKQYDACVQGNLNLFARQGDIDYPLDGRTCLTRFRVQNYDAETDQSLVT